MTGQQDVGTTGTPGPVPLALLTLMYNVPIGILTYGYGFTAAYMLNDNVTPADHRAFAVPGLLGMLVAAALMTGTMRQTPGIPTGRAAVNALAASAALNLVFIGIVVSNVG